MLKEFVMNCNFLEKISLLVDDELPPIEVEETKSHLTGCWECRQAKESFLTLREQIKSIQFKRDAAADRKVLNEILQNGKTQQVKSASVFTFFRLATASAMLLIIGFATIFIYNWLPQKSWEVTSVSGMPKIGAEKLAGSSRLKIGEWLETDNSSEAKIAVADIGSVEVEPGTRIRLVETRPEEHRLELERGSINALINAPPRLFYVNTPSATVIDYGCAYSLNVEDDGITTLHVTEGWVSLVLNGRESLVPASAYAKSKLGIGPGTPFFEDASGEFVDALTRFDFENGGSPAIDVIIARARERDALSLWYLLERANKSDRNRIFDRLASFVPLPENATRDGVLALDRRMLDAWQETIDVTSVGSSLANENQNEDVPSRLVAIENMNIPRAKHTATLLPEGRVLIVGGMQKEGDILSSVETFDPEFNRFLPTGSMISERYGHTATLLRNNQILIAGGADSNGNSLSSTEIYNPATGAFAAAENLNFARANHQAILLDDGKILITGGVDSNHSALSSAEVYDPEKGAFLAAGNMTALREFHTANLLKDGNVLIAGGKTGKPSPETTLSNTELYNPLTRAFVSIGNMTERRYSHAANLLSDGRVLITGGSTGREWKDRTSGAEIYDPQRKSFAKTGEMSLPRFNHQAATLQLLDGRILVAGSGARLETFNPLFDSFTSIPGNVGTGRVFSTATLFSNGKVLITGGYNFDYPPTASAWLYSP